MNLLDLDHLVLITTISFFIDKFMKINAATICDKNYLVRALALYNSIIKNIPDSIFWFLCADEDSKHILQSFNLPNTVIINFDDLNDPELLEAKNNRSFAEFIFTSKPALINHILNKISDGDVLIYDDADLFYFSSPEKILNIMKNDKYSIGIVPHKFPKDKEYMNERVGRYNAGLLYLIADQNSRLCVSEWRKQCIDWCYLKYEKDRFGDQLYMNKWPEKYQGVYEIKDKGVNLGSWSIYDFKITKKDGRFFVDNDPLICYHFHRIKFYLESRIVEPLPIYVYNKELYKDYAKGLELSLQKMSSLHPDWSNGFVEKPNILRVIKQKLHRLVVNLIHYRWI